MWFFLWFPVRFQVFSISYRSSAIVSNKTVRDFDRSGPSQAIDICNAFDSFWHTGLLNKLTYYEILCQIFSLIFFLSVMSILVAPDVESDLRTRNGFGSSHQRCSIEIGVFKYFAKFTGKHRDSGTDVFLSVLWNF